MLIGKPSLNPYEGNKPLNNRRNCPIYIHEILKDPIHSFPKTQPDLRFELIFLLYKLSYGK